MIKNIFSRFSPKYINTLIYMLQSTEYYVDDYLAWYHKTKNFINVQKSGKLDKTKKVQLLIVAAWLEVLLLCTIVIIITLMYLSVFGYSPLFIFLFIPYLLPYLIIIPVLFINYFIQKPFELLIAKKVKTEIQNHKALKVAIAGSYGKTSMREILKDVLSEGKIVAAPGGSLNTLWGINSFVKSLSGKEDILIFELGEYHIGDIRKLCNIVQPDIGFITGINEAHLKRFKTLDKTVQAIYEIVDYLINKPVYINGENELAAKNARGNYKLYSKKGIGETKVTTSISDLTGTSFTIKQRGETQSFHSNLLGLHQVGPIIASIDLAREIGLTDKQIFQGVKATKPFSRRLEYKSNINGVITLDDSYNGNPDGVAAVIDFLSDISVYRRFYITSGLVEMGRRDRVVHLEIGRKLAEAKIEKILLVRTSVTPYIAEGLADNNYQGEIIWFDDTASAYASLPHLTVAGDVVLLQNDWPDQYR